MGLVEKIGRKLSGSCSNQLVPSKADGSRAAEGGIVPHLPHSVDHHDGPQSRHVCPHMANPDEQPRIIQIAAMGSRNDSRIVSPNVKTAESWALARQRDAAQGRATELPQTNVTVASTSRLTGRSPERRNALPNSTVPSTTGSFRSENLRVSLENPTGHPSTIHEQPRIPPPLHSSTISKKTSVPCSLHSNTIHRQPSIASSLHSERTGPPVSYSNKIGQRQTTPQKRTSRPADPRPFGMSSRRMENSAYHAGFRDAVAQLERERTQRGPSAPNR